IPERIGYNRDARGLLLTNAVPVPETGEIPRHQRFYYLELLRRAGMMERFPPGDAIRLDGIDAARESGAAQLTALVHLAAALGVPTLAVFGATDDATTGPTGPLARVVREHAECSPCLLRECPIDHRCMTRVTADRVSTVALQLWEESDPAWTHVAKS